MDEIIKELIQKADIEIRNVKLTVSEEEGISQEEYEKKCMLKAIKYNSAAFKLQMIENWLNND